ncbi:MAG: prepilin peptidase [Defluviitaleaceae bacterium]|nr:prepilin peptidase [Defluviitaleaceae bacterium]
MPFIIAVAFLLGLCFGSFANVVIYRVPAGKSIVKPPSACRHCGNRLKFFELFPVVSWLFLCGKCRTCKKKISLRYPLVELLCALLFAGMAWFSPTLSLVPLLVFVFVLLVISFIDADTMEIPDGLVVAGAIAGIIFVFGGHFGIFPGAVSWLDALLGAVAGAAPLLIIDRIVILLLEKDGFGFGDVKLMAMVGLFIGWQLMLLAFSVAFISAAPFAIYLMATGKRGGYIAFGPFLCAGSLAALWFGNYFKEVFT